MATMPLPRKDMIDMLDRERCPWSWEYPGILVMRPLPGILVNTGLNGYEYGSIYSTAGQELGVADPWDGSVESWQSWLGGFRAGYAALASKVA